MNCLNSFQSQIMSKTTKVPSWVPSWSALGTGCNSYVRAIYAYDLDNVFAGGGFTSAGGVNMNYIAKYGS